PAVARGAGSRKDANLRVAAGGGFAGAYLDALLRAQRGLFAGGPHPGVAGGGAVCRENMDTGFAGSRDGRRPSSGGGDPDVVRLPATGQKKDGADRRLRPGKRSIVRARIT